MVSLNSDQVEIITIKIFAEKMLISPKTVYSWIAAGRLGDGSHVIRVGGIIRILWSQDLLKHLLSLSSLEDTVRSKLTRKGKGGRNCCALDPGYLDC